MTDTDRDTAATLTEDEVAASDFTTVTGRPLWDQHAVERILAARLAAQPPQDDPQPDEREALVRIFYRHLPGDDHSHLFLDHGSRRESVRCRCGWVQPSDMSHDDHLADTVLAAGFRRTPQPDPRACETCGTVRIDGWCAWCDPDDDEPARTPQPRTDIGLRERLGRRVREVWVAWAHEQPNPKPSWLVGWDDLPESDREVDRRIGETLYARGRRTPQPRTDLRERVADKIVAVMARELDHGTRILAASRLAADALIASGVVAAPEPATVREAQALRDGAEVLLAEFEDLPDAHSEQMTDFEDGFTEAMTEAHALLRGLLRADRVPTDTTGAGQDEGGGR